MSLLSKSFIKGRVYFAKKYPWRREDAKYIFLSTALTDFKLYATEASITAIASPGKLNITYPYGNSSSIFTLLVSPFSNKLDVTTWSDLQGLSVNISGNISPDYSLSFCGNFGGSCSTIVSEEDMPSKKQETY